MSKLNCVLLVDDDDTSNFLNENIISDLAVAEHVHAASNGEEALHFIYKNCHKIQNMQEAACPELVLLDINMPVMDGFEFLEKYSQLDDIIKKRINIVMLTSSQNQQDIERSRSYNISGYIDKPLTEQKLRQLLYGGQSSQASVK